MIHFIYIDGRPVPVELKGIMGFCDFDSCTNISGAELFGLLRRFGFKFEITQSDPIYIKIYWIDTTESVSTAYRITIDGYFEFMSFIDIPENIEEMIEVDYAIIDENDVVFENNKNSQDNVCWQTEGF